VAPFEPVAASAADARRVEESVREALTRRAGICLEARAETLERLTPFPARRLPPCPDVACHRAQLEALGVDELVRGLVIGAGGVLHLELERATPSRTLHGEAVLSGDHAAAAAMSALSLWDEARPAAPPRWPAVAATAAAVAAASVGLALGLEARRLEAQLSRGDTGCPAGAPDFRDCVDGLVRDGRGKAGAATALSVAAGLLAGGAVLLWVVELP
jgi:hypothetical protein